MSTDLTHLFGAESQRAQLLVAAVVTLAGTLIASKAAALLVAPSKESAMKMRSIKSCGVIAGLLACGTAWSIPVSTVGTLDALVSSTTLANSGEATESAWVSSVLGYTVTFEDKTECSCSWQSVDGTPDWFALDFGLEAPSYYLVKTGNGSSIDADSPSNGSDTHFLFENLSELRYGVISLTQLGFGGTLNIRKVSHVTEFDNVPVPEPTTLTLFGLGLLGAAAGRKRKRSA
jgi:hypothetical protein